MPFTIKVVLDPNSASDTRETLISDVTRISLIASDLGDSLVASISDESSWTFGPYAPNPLGDPYIPKSSRLNVAASVYVMNDSGKTVDSYHLNYGDPSAWDKQFPDAATLGDQPTHTPPITTGGSIFAEAYPMPNPSSRTHVETLDPFLADILTPDKVEELRGGLTQSSSDTAASDITVSDPTT